MTRHDPKIDTGIGIGAKRMVLATDLDGTFLGGDAADRRALYDWVEANRDTVGLIFVTGRDPEFILGLCASGVPRPDYVIGDVGTTIAEMSETAVTPLPALEAEIAALWADAGPRVRDLLDGAAGLKLQPTAFRYRVSYDFDRDAYDGRAEAHVADLGLDALISDNRFFDVLPKGVSKGPSLLRLIDHLGIAPGRCLAAGDTLNDLSMLAAGVPAVAVGGAEPALIERVRSLGHVHKARAVGAAGILEAIAAFDLHPLN